VTYDTHPPVGSEGHADRLQAVRVTGQTFGLGWVGVASLLVIALYLLEVI
jgi:hypothetical protein